jgi:transposase-like protein
MMTRRAKRTFTREFKAKVALDALKEHKTLEQLSQEYELSQSQISTWKQLAKAALPEVFGSSSDKFDEQNALISTLYEQIGRLKIENDFLKKKHNHEP